MMKVDAANCAYRIASAEDQGHVVTVAALPGLSCLAPNAAEALADRQELVRDVLADLAGWISAGAATCGPGWRNVILLSFGRKGLELLSKFRDTGGGAGCYPCGVLWGSLKGTRLAGNGAIKYQKCRTGSLARQE